MKDLIEALQILVKYFNEDSYSPTHCEHDVLAVFPDRVDEITDKDETRLGELGFYVGEHDVAGGDVCVYSYRFGSC